MKFFQKIWTTNTPTKRKLAVFSCSYDNANLRVLGKVGVGCNIRALGA